MRTIRSGAVVSLLMASLSSWQGSAAAQQPVNPTAAALAEFDTRVKAYMDLHKKEAAQVPQKKNATPEDVMAAEKALGERLKAARADAKQGDLFVSAVVPLFKKVFSDYYKRRTGREIRLLFDEVPNFKPQVNMTYPVNAPKATFPPRLALELPQLPDQLEYRLVITDLVIRDTEANLIVDYLPSALPPSVRK
jgi:hypothetical protein